MVFIAIDVRETRACIKSEDVELDPRFLFYDLRKVDHVGQASAARDAKFDNGYLVMPKILCTVGRPQHAVGIIRALDQSVLLLRPEIARARNPRRLAEDVLPSATFDFRQ